MSRQHSALLTAAALISALVSVRAARAQEGLEALLAAPIESTSGKATGTADSAPALSLNVSAEDLSRHGIRTLAEAYKFLTMGLVTEDPLGDPEVGSRGVLVTGDHGKHVLLLLNGHALNDPETGASVHGHGFGLPIEMIDHVEIVLGPGSVLYGSNAMFGVINVITKRAKEIDGVQLVAEAAFSPPLNRAHNPLGPGDVSPYLPNLGQSYRVAGLAGYTFTLAHTPAELTAALEYYTFKGPLMTWGPQPDTVDRFGPRGTMGSWGGTTTASYYERTPSGYVRLIAGDFDASARVVASRLSSPYVRRNDSLPDPTYFDDPDAYTDRLNVALDLKWHHDFSEVVSVLGRLYGDSSAQSNRLHLDNFYGCFAPYVARKYQPCTASSSAYARWLGTEIQASFDWTHKGTIVTMIGTDARVRRVGFENGIEATDTGQTAQYSNVDRTEEAIAFYAQQLYRPSKWLTLNAGARWDVDSNFGNRLSPRGAVIVDAWRGATIKAIYSEALRAPTTDEETFRDPTRALVSQNLRPESVRSVEGIFHQRFGTHSLILGVFGSWWHDMIVFHELINPLTANTTDANIVRDAQRAGLLNTSVHEALQYQNIGSIQDVGLNAGYEGTLLLGRFAYGLNVTAAYARSNTPEGTRLITVTPSWFGNARVSYDFGQRLPTVALAAHFSGQRLADAGQDSNFAFLPYAPPALDLKAAITGPFPWVPHFSYRVTGDYSLAGTSPYAAGIIRTGYEGPAPELIPANRATIMLSLQYSIPQKGKAK